MKKQTQNQTVIGIDLGDKKHLICVTGKGAEVLKEYELANRRQDLERLAKEYPKARVALEVGTHSPWISRLLQKAGLEVWVANPRKLRAIYEQECGLKQNDPVVAYCRIGERSSLTWFVLTYLLGYPNVRNYDGSWTEWGNLVRAPIAKGA